MRSNLLKLNTYTSLLNQIVTLICGFILPRLILLAYGSETNGLINSISQFLGIITFLELGVGAVVQSALYKPLADRDNVAVSRIMVSAQKFFGNLSRVLLFYIVVLVFCYPLIARHDYRWIYTASMIVIMSISSFAQYYWGITDALLLRANQRGYILYMVQIVTVLLNTVACFYLIEFGAGIHVVKLTTSLCYVFKPIFTHWYIQKHYQVNRKITYDEEPIKQKWNGVAQHVAAVILDGTDNIVLTLFSTLSNVSIYTVYYLVVAGVKNVLLSLTNGIHALIGELWAKQELEELRNIFGWFEWILHTGTVFVFGCTGVLLIPFVSVYTQGVTDTNYIQPIFATLLTIANAGHCLRLPYNVMILAGGHYKQTQKNYIVAAGLNIVLSIGMVIRYGLIGVAIGTMAAMLYQTVWMAHYVSKNLIKWPFEKFTKQIFVDVLSVVLGILTIGWIQMDSVNYTSWIVMAVKVAINWLVVMIPINAIFYSEYVIILIDMIKKIINRLKSRDGSN